MRKFLFFVFVLMIASCEKPVILQNEDAQLNISLLLKGDYVAVSVSPLTKGDMSKTYYAFEIDSVRIDSLEWDRYEWQEPMYQYDTTYFHYAGGVFTDIKGINISLDKGHRYRIRCSIITDKEDELYVKDGYVYEPFVAPDYNYGVKAQINNAFIYGGEKKIYAYNPAPYIRTIDEEKKISAMVNRYYGEIITDVIDKDSPLLLEMERRNFGLHLLFTPPSEGVLTIFQNYGSPEFTYKLDSKSSSIDEEYVYALDLKNNHKILDIKIQWTRADGKIVDLSPGKTKFYNKTMTTIKVDVNERVGNSDIEINYNSTMTHDEISIK